MNTPVNFELAKLLNEKNIKIHSIFRGRGYHWYLDGDKDEFGDPLDNGTGVWKLANFNTHTREEYSAPTIGDVVMWLYEKHGIWIAVVRFKDHSADNNEKPTFRHNFLFKDYNSPTEAYEAAIEYTLNNLI